MSKTHKNPAAVALGRIGGSKTSEAKRKAAVRNIRKRWRVYYETHPKPKK